MSVLLMEFLSLQLLLMVQTCTLGRWSPAETSVGLTTTITHQQGASGRVLGGGPPAPPACQKMLIVRRITGEDADPEFFVL